MQAAALAAASFAALLLQGCDREPSRSALMQPAAAASQAAAPPAPVQRVQPPRPARPAQPQMVQPPRRVQPAPPVARSDGDAEGALLLARRSLMLPVVGVSASALSDHFKLARGQRVHEAIDIMAPRGTPVVAVDDGRIAKLFTSRGGGLTVYHFDPTGRLAYYYAHLDRYAAGLKEGAAVQRGDVIGYVGSTGNANPAAPHLHFTVFKLGPERKWWQGEVVNPYPALSRAVNGTARHAAR